MGFSLLMQHPLSFRLTRRPDVHIKNPSWCRVSPYICFSLCSFVIAAPLRFKNWPQKDPGSHALSFSWQPINRFAGMCARSGSPKLLCERCIGEGFLTAKPLKPTPSSPAGVCHHLTVSDLDFYSAPICQTIVYSSLFFTSISFSPLLPCHLFFVL